MRRVGRERRYLYGGCAAARGRFPALSVEPPINRPLLQSRETGSPGGFQIPMGEYQFVATSLGGFVQQVAVCYIGRGYYHFVTGCIPDRKDPAVVDRKLIDRYKPDITKWSRARRKKAGLANVQYIRLGRFFALLATDGEHRFFRDEPHIRDARRVALRVGGYTISYRGGHPHVRIRHDDYLGIKSRLLDLALRRSAEDLAREFSRIPYEPYAPIRAQVFGILRAVNRARDRAGLEPVASSCVRVKRRSYRPFERGEAAPAEPARPAAVGGFVLPRNLDGEPLAPLPEAGPDPPGGGR